MKNKAFIPFLMGISMAVGMWLGSGLISPFGQAQQKKGWDKIDQILQYVENDYVDTVSRARLEDEVVAYLLQRLDPHSYYIAEEDLISMNEPLEGNFEGIGVQFNLRSDTIYVVSTIPGGPSEKAGILPGDLIVQVDTQIIAGTGLTNRKVMKWLKGPEGTSVKVGVKRKGIAEVLPFVITRGEIPISSFDALYLLNDSTIYLKLARFSKTTYNEFQERVYPLLTENVNGFVMDLRSNGGGYLDAAVNLADEFLSEGKVITYTQGKNRPRREYRSTDKGNFEDVRLSVIIDGYSASASEIFAGAIQDLNRGSVVGKRSYGKGLVQEQNEWTDGSATRLTVARYYTPNGRSIQRPYESLATSDRMPADSLLGGIRPDRSVDRDTSGVTWLFAELVHSGTLVDFAYAYRDARMDLFQGLHEEAFDAAVSTSSLESALREYMISKEETINEKEWKRSIDRITLRAKAIIGRSLFGDNLYYQLFNQNDPFVKAALQEMKKPALQQPAS